MRLQFFTVLYSRATIFLQCWGRPSESSHPWPSLAYQLGLQDRGTWWLGNLHRSSLLSSWGGLLGRIWWTPTCTLARPERHSKFSHIIYCILSYWTLSMKTVYNNNRHTIENIPSEGAEAWDLTYELHESKPKGTHGGTHSCWIFQWFRNFCLTKKNITTASSPQHALKSWDSLTKDDSSNKTAMKHNKYHIVICMRWYTYLLANISTVPFST